jgi:hypothetical protein
VIHAVERAMRGGAMKSQWHMEKALVFFFIVAFSPVFSRCRREITITNLSLF